MEKKTMAVRAKVPSNTPWEELSQEASGDRRRERRLNLSYPIEIFGFDAANHYFTEHSVTENVSHGGCLFRLKTQVNPKTVLAIRVVSRETKQPQGYKPILFLVAWVKKEGNGWAVGASKLQPENLWQIAVPERASPSEKDSGTA